MDKNELPTVLQTDESRRRARYMEYVEENTTARNPKKRAGDCDKYMQRLAKSLRINTVYSIDSVDKADEIRDRLRRRGDLHSMDDCLYNGGMRAAMGHYVNFLQDNPQKGV